jgi:AcrR family transcriptional regulator
MPPKTIFMKDQIIESAFEIFKEEGIDSLSVRKIALKLGSSTAPVYTCFANIEEIKKLVMEKSLAELLTYTEKEYTKDIFLNIGVGMLEFARSNKKVYRDLFVNTNEYHYILKAFNEKNLLQMRKVNQLDIFEEADLRGILEKMCIYTHGLATFLCSGMLDDDSREFLINTLNEVGGSVMAMYALRKGVFEQFMNSAFEGSC